MTDIVPAAQPYYDRVTLGDALSDVQTWIDEWDYDKDPHGYCHQRPLLVRLMEAVDPALYTQADLTEAVLAISTMIDASYPSGLDPEAHRWRRCGKVLEEAGEVMEALLGLVGENPRKGVTHGLDDVVGELLDVAIAALGAVAHLNRNRANIGVRVARHAVQVRTRLAASLAERAQ